MKKIILTLIILAIVVFGQYYDPRKYIEKKGLCSLQVYIHDTTGTGRDTDDTTFIFSTSVHTDSVVATYISGTATASSKADSLKYGSAYFAGTSYLRSDREDTVNAFYYFADSVLAVGKWSWQVGRGNDTIMFFPKVNTAIYLNVGAGIDTPLVVHVPDPTKLSAYFDGYIIANTIHTDSEFTENFQLYNLTDTVIMPYYDISYGNFALFVRNAGIAGNGILIDSNMAYGAIIYLGKTNSYCGIKAVSYRDSIGAWSPSNQVTGFKAEPGQQYSNYIGFWSHYSSGIDTLHRVGFLDDGSKGFRCDLLGDSSIQMNAWGIYDLSGSKYKVYDPATNLLLADSIKSKAGVWMLGAGTLRGSSVGGDTILGDTTQWYVVINGKNKVKIDSKGVRLRDSVFVSTSTIDTAKIYMSNDTLGITSKLGSYFLDLRQATVLFKSGWMLFDQLKPATNDSTSSSIGSAPTPYGHIFACSLLVAGKYPTIALTTGDDTFLVDSTTLFKLVSGGKRILRANSDSIQLFGTQVKSNGSIVMAAGDSIFERDPTLADTSLSYDNGTYHYDIYDNPLYMMGKGNNGLVYNWVSIYPDVDTSQTLGLPTRRWTDGFYKRINLTSPAKTESTICFQDAAKVYHIRTDPSDSAAGTPDTVRVHGVLQSTSDLIVNGAVKSTKESKFISGFTTTSGGVWSITGSRQFYSNDGANDTLFLQFGIPCDVLGSDAIIDSVIVQCYCGSSNTDSVRFVIQRNEAETTVGFDSVWVCGNASYRTINVMAINSGVFAVVENNSYRLRLNCKNDAVGEICLDGWIKFVYH